MITVKNVRGLSNLVCLTYLKLLVKISVLYKYVKGDVFLHHVDYSFFVVMCIIYLEK